MKVRKMFSRYVSPAALTVMVDQYADYRSAGSGSKETVSILFSDIRGFTSLSEHADAEVVVKILNHYLGNMTEVILKKNGTIDKFIGDAIMAIWGAPIKSETYSADAVNAALEMLEKLNDVNAWLLDQGLFPLDIGIGINTGEVILGSIGSEQKADYTVIGDNVNLAARLEGITKTYSCKIIIAESTCQQAGDQIPCALVDMVRVKGKEKPIKIFTPVRALPDLKSLPLDDALRIADLSRQAFDQYLERHWDAAINLYLQFPPCPLRTLHLERCADYKVTPPPLDWDGAYTMTSK
jgi:adenylate cyclase